jgi:hypothetical protein
VDLAARRATGEGIDRLGWFFIVEGSDYDDTLIGDYNFNEFLPGPGDDTVRGGGGPDFVLFDLAPGPVTVDLALGTASGEGTDILAEIEGAQGSAFDDTLTGNAGSNPELASKAPTCRQGSRKNSGGRTAGVANRGVGFTVRPGGLC